MDIGYTREMETELDKIESEHHDWRQMLHAFYGPFKENLDQAHEVMSHAKAQTEPAPYECAECGAPTVYRFGKNGRFLSCSRYPKCKYAAPIDRDGKPRQAQLTDILCPIDGQPMVRRDGRFGPFLASANYPEVKFILKLDPKKGTVVLPKTPPLTTGAPCPKCGEPLNMRDSKRGYWLSCSTFPKCRGRGKWGDIDEAQQKELDARWHEHVKQNPLPEIRNTAGQLIGEDYLPKLLDESNQPENPVPFEGDAGSANSDAA
jgi:DNA topoisomerase-1